MIPVLVSTEWLEDRLDTLADAWRRMDWANGDGENLYRQIVAFQNAEPYMIRLSCRVGGDSSVRERDLDAGAAEVDHRDQCVG